MLVRRLIPVLVTSLLAILAVTPAAAAPPDKFTMRTTSLFLSAFVPEAGVFVDLFRNGDGTYTVCVGTANEFRGCGTVAADAVQVDEDNLATATLGPVTVQLERCDESGCEPGATVMVALTFTGTGELTKFQSRFKSSNGCKIMGSSKGIQRQGTATLTIDGDVYEAVAFLSTAQETFKVQCRR